MVFFLKISITSVLLATVSGLFFENRDDKSRQRERVVMFGLAAVSAVAVLSFIWWWDFP